MPPPEQEIVWTVVVAGGSGARFGGAKQYMVIGNHRMVDLSVSVAAACTHGVVVVVPPDDVDREAVEIAATTPSCRVVAGGSTRSESVRNGLDAIPADASIVCVHDAARPFASPALFDAVVSAVAAGVAGAVPGLAVTDTIKAVDPAGRVLATPDRSTLVAVQTPQAFRADVLRRAYSTADDGTDDAALVERLGATVIVVAGEPDNRKVTHPDDLTWARRHIEVADLAVADRRVPRPTRPGAAT